MLNTKGGGIMVCQLKQISSRFFLFGWLDSEVQDLWQNIKVQYNVMQSNAKKHRAK